MVEEEDGENPKPPEPEPEPEQQSEPEHQPTGDEIPDTIRERLETFVPELVRRTFAAGMGALFTTEEGIRKITKDMPLPKDVAGYLASTASTTKDEVMRIMAREIREFLQGVNISEEIAKMLTMLSFEVKTEIRFIPNDEKYGGVEPDVKASVKLKKQGEDEGAGKSERGLRRRLSRRSKPPPEGK
jgi:hypothetical protein